MNSIGQRLRLTTFGESHGVALGGILDGIPAGWQIDLSTVQRMVDRRRPGVNSSTTARHEPDLVRWLSGLTSEGQTLGSPIAFVIENQDARSGDYISADPSLGKPLRSNHADLTYWLKYNLEPQPGGGRASGRETIARVVAGAIAEQWLRQQGIEIYAFLQQVGPIRLEDDYTCYDLATTYSHDCYTPSASHNEEFKAYIEQLRSLGDSSGGAVRCVVQHLPPGIGEPIFDRIPARLSYALMSIPGSRAFSFGDGISLAAQRGSQILDRLTGFDERGMPRLASNHNGGALGGISTGADLWMEVTFKPTPSIAQPQETCTTTGESVTHIIRGRHDPCIAIRAVPVVQAMVALTLADLILINSYQESN